jgi:hypothetical protein
MLGAERLVYGRLGGALFTCASTARCRRRSPGDTGALHADAARCTGSTPQTAAPVTQLIRRPPGPTRCGSPTAAPASWRPRTRWPPSASAPPTATAPSSATSSSAPTACPSCCTTPTLERTTNGHGRPGDRPWAELSQLDAGGWHSARLRRRAAAHAAAPWRASCVLANGFTAGEHRDQADARPSFRRPVRRTGNRPELRRVACWPSRRHSSRQVQPR